MKLKKMQRIAKDNNWKLYMIREHNFLVGFQRTCLRKRSFLKRLFNSQPEVYKFKLMVYYSNLTCRLIVCIDDLKVADKIYKELDGTKLKRFLINPLKFYSEN